MKCTYSQSPWSLTDLFPSHDSPEMQAAFAELGQRLTDFEARRLQLADNLPSESFIEIICQLEALPMS